MLDYFYFGPPSDGRISPYWNPNVPYNLNDARGQIYKLMEGLSERLSKNPYGGIPEQLRCLCPGAMCLLPEFNRYCQQQGIRRVDVNPIAMAKSDDRFVHFVHFMNHAQIAEIGVQTIVRAKHASEVALAGKSYRDELAKLWYVKDVEALFYAVMLPGSKYRALLIEHLRKF